MAGVAEAIASGVRNINVLTDGVFFARHPERRGRPLRAGETQLAAEWRDIRDKVVRPALAKAPSPGPAPAPSDAPLGTLTCNLPGRTPFVYRITADDLLTTARFLIGEAGGTDNAENRGTLWAMLNRYAFFRPEVPGWGSFGNFLKQYSQMLQPFIRHFESVQEFVARCNKSFDNPECQFRPIRPETYPGTTVPMGQLKSALALQATPWSGLQASARELALAVLTGKIPSPIGNATEVDDTKVYFRREHGRQPSRAEWEDYTRRFAQAKSWDWRPQQIAYDEFGHNALFVTTKARGFPEGAVRIIAPSGTSNGSASNPATASPPGAPLGKSPKPAPKPTPNPSATNGAAPPQAGTGSDEAFGAKEVEDFATKLAATWSAGRSGKPSAAEFRSWLIKDHQDTLAGASNRYKGKYPASTVSRAWMISREQQMMFQTRAAKGLKALASFDPPASPAKRVTTKLVPGSDEDPVAPIVVSFVSELRKRHPRFDLWTYARHGGGSFSGKGYSIDLDIEGRDARGFYRPEDAIAFLRAVDEAAKAAKAEWRVLYNDFAAADAINRETGFEHVFFIGSPTADKKNIIWHGPAPLILHFHLDLVPR